ncbi:phage portal protein [Ruminococcus flavefaciens]|uniref:phage portal protein n=1 Tax=Ruminococcus flavefaciens TaxID=1265 RepID=UPI003F092ECC
MRYNAMFVAVAKELGEHYYSSATARAIELWSRMYRGHAPWNSSNTKSSGVASSIASEAARLITIELKGELTGSEALSAEFDKLLPKLRRFVEYGTAKGSLVIKPIVVDGAITTQFIQADRFFPLRWDSSGNLIRCAFADQLRDGNTIYTLLEIHSFENGVLTVQNRLYRSGYDGLLGKRVPLSAVDKWAKLDDEGKFTGIDRLPFGLFNCPIANNIDEDSPMGVSVYSRAVELICEADKRYSGESWEYESKETAVHIGSSMLRYDKEQDKYIYPGGRNELYRAVEIDSGAVDKPCLEVYSPEIRHEAYKSGWNEQLRRIEFACNLAYGTISDPNSVDRTATEIEASKQRSYTFICDCQKALETALYEWAEGAAFWLALSGQNSAYDMKLEWGDGILANPDAERDEDRKDLANGTLRPEEYRAKYRNETVEEALKNLPQSSEVMQ